jgi:hypothetical protein
VSSYSFYSYKEVAIEYSMTLNRPVGAMFASFALVHAFLSLAAQTAGDFRDGNPHVVLGAPDEFVNVVHDSGPGSGFRKT